MPKFSASESVSESVDYNQEKNGKRQENGCVKFWALHQEF